MPDRDWLQQVYSQFRRPLFLTAWNILRSPELAEDAVHSAFVRLAELSEAPVEPKLYVFRSVRNSAIDLARARGRMLEEPIRDHEPAAHDASDDAHDAVEQVLVQLEERSREVIELHLHGKLTFQEIAVLCNEPLPTVASRYRRALERLRHLLEIPHE